MMLRLSRPFEKIWRVAAHNGRQIGSGRKLNEPSGLSKN